jgi:DNA-binding NarL/FixJ family response regulator
MSLPDQSNKPTLTDREFEILKLIAMGHSNKEIAATLGIATSTVEWHVHTILQKLGAANRVQAVVIAMRLGCIAAEDI